MEVQIYFTNNSFANSKTMYDKIVERIKRSSQVETINISINPKKEMLIDILSYFPNFYTDEERELIKKSYRNYYYRIDEVILTAYGVRLEISPRGNNNRK